jgi:hypothetical protein
MWQGAWCERKTSAQGDFVSGFEVGENDTGLTREQKRRATGPRKSEDDQSERFAKSAQRPGRNLFARSRESHDGGIL